MSYNMYVKKRVIVVSMKFRYILEILASSFFLNCLGLINTNKKPTNRRRLRESYIDYLIVALDTLTFYRYTNIYYISAKLHFRKFK